MRTDFQRHGRQYCSLGLVIAWVAAGWGTSAIAFADDPAPTSQPAAEATTQPATDNGELTVDTTPLPTPVKSTSLEEVQALTKRVESATTATLSDAQKEEALTALSDAKKLLEERDTWEAQAKAFRERSESAPKDLERLKQVDVATQPTTQPTSQPTTTSAPVDDVKLDELESQLRTDQAKLETARTQVTQADAALTRRNTLLSDGPRQIAEARSQLSDLEASKLNSEGPDLLVEARRVKRIARRMMLEQKVAALEAELKFYENDGELLLLQRDRLAQRRDALDVTVKALRTRVAAMRQQAAEQAKEKAEDVNARVRRIFPEITQLIEENKSLAEARSARSQNAATLTQIEQVVEAEQKRIDEEFKEAKELEKSASISNSYGLMLRSHLATLPDTGEFRLRREKRKEEMAEAELKLTEFGFQWRQLRGMESVINEWKARMPDGLAERDRALVMEEVKRQLELKLENLTELLKRDYISDLQDLIGKLSSLIDTTEQFRAFINERILWVRSGRPIGADGFKGLVAAFRWFFNAENWGGFLNSAAAYYSIYWFLLIPGAVVIGVLIAVRRSVRRKLRLQAAKANEPLSTDFKVTLATCFYTLLLALPYPLLLWFIGKAFAQVPEGDFAQAVASGFYSAGMAAFPLLLFIHVCRVHGLAGAHLGWDAKSIGILRRNLLWFVGATVPVSFVVSMLSHQANELFSETFGRDVFILGMIFVTIFLARVLRPKAGALTQYMIEHPQGRLTKLRYPLYVLFVTIPIVLAAGAALGYYYTVLRLSARYWLTAIIWFAAIVVYLLLMRWLLLVRRKIAIDQAMRKRAEAKAKAEAEAKAQAERAARKDGTKPDDHVEAPPATVQIEEPSINIPSLSQQTRQLIGSLTIFTVAALTFAVWVREMPALGILRDIQIGEWGISVADVGLALIAAIVSIIAVRNIPALLEISVLAHLPLDAGTRYAVSAISRYIIGTIGIVVTFGLVNIGWSKVQWLIAAVSVGLGFGLQEIFANFVSGLIILFERPIRIGDTVTVGSQTGTVSRIRIRATSITDWDNKELIIPNKRFVTDEITNWTLSNQILRQVIPVGVSYSSNPRQVRDVLLDVAKSNNKVMEDPSPRVYFLGFGDSALNFECRVYFKNFDDLLVGRHQMYVEIFEACQKNGIEIAFPQRDIHIRSIKATLPLKREHRTQEKLETLDEGEGDGDD